MSVSRRLSIGLVPLLLLFGASASPLFAQDIYVTGGWMQVWREPPWAISFETPAAPAASPLPTATIGAGLWIGRHIAVEGTLGLYRAQSVPWKWRYLFGVTASDQVAVDRDLPLTGTIRMAPLRGHRIAIEPVLGGGLNFHRSRSYVTATCGPAMNPTPCVPVQTRAESDALTTGEWLMTAGADVPIRVSARFDILPGLRFMLVRRRQYLTGYNHRGPVIGGGALPGVGVSARYVFTAPSSR